MPKIVVTVDAKGVQRYADATFGDISIEMDEVKDFFDSDVGLTAKQVNMLVRLLDGGVSLTIEDDGTMVINHPQSPATTC